jgi:hypothetical protein
MKRLSLLALCLLAVSCMQVDDHLQLAADGSATITLSVEGHDSLEQLRMARWQNAERLGQVAGLWYPPITADDAQRVFGGATLQVEAGERGLRLSARFDTVEALLASPYAQVHDLEISSDGARLLVRGRHGVGSLHGLDSYDSAAQPPFGLSAETLAAYRRWSHAWRLTLPGQEQATSWELVADGSAPERSRLLALREGSVPLPAGFPPLPAPWTPALHSWSQLVAGAVPPRLESARAVSAQGLRAEILSLECRTTFLYGDSWPDNEATLLLLVSMPKEQAFDEWPALSDLQIVDDQGNSLNKEDNSADPDQPSRGLVGLPEGHVGQVYRVNCKAPGDQASGIASCSGALPIMLGERRQVVCPLESALPATLFSAPPKLPLTLTLGGERAGSSLLVRGVTDQKFVQMLNLSLSGEPLRIIDILAYGADGQPWPSTYLGQRGTGCMLLLWGRPSEELHLALRLQEAAGPALRQEARFSVGPLPFPARPASPARSDDEDGMIWDDSETLDLSGIPIVDNPDQPGCTMRLSEVETRRRHQFPAAARHLGRMARMDGEGDGHQIQCRFVALAGRSLLKESGALDPPTLLDALGAPLAVRSCRANWTGEEDEMRIGIDCALLPDGVNHLATFDWQPVLATCGSWQELFIDDPQPGTTYALEDLQAGSSLRFLSRKKDRNGHGDEATVQLHGHGDLRLLRVSLLSSGVSPEAQHGYISQTKEGSDENGAWRRLQLNTQIWDDDERSKATGLRLRVAIPRDLRRERLRIHFENVDLR